MQNVWNKPPLPKENGFYWVCSPGFQTEGQPPTEYSKPSVDLIQISGDSSYVMGSDRGGKASWYVEDFWIKVPKPDALNLPPTIRPAVVYGAEFLGSYGVACTVSR